MLTPRIISPHYNNRLLKNSIFFIIGLLFLVGLLQGFVLTVKGSNSAVADKAYRLYHSDQFHYSLSYPANWKLDPVISDTNVVTISSQANSLHSPARTYNLKGQTDSFPHSALSLVPFSKVDIVVYSLEEPLSVAEFVARVTKSPLEGQVSQRHIAGQSALLVELNTIPDDVIYRNAFITSNQQGFIIAGLTSAAIFEHILESFQLD